jgi:uncharacterized protein (TIGR02757 family)
MVARRVSGVQRMDVVQSPSVNKSQLEELYTCYNRREFVSPDPLEFLYDYDDARDREIVALIASSLAYGRVGQILKSVSTVLERMSSPSDFLKRASRESLRQTFANFKHRFTTGEGLAAMLYGVKKAVERYGSLHACFLDGLGEGDETVLPALSVFVAVLDAGANGNAGSLMPSPSGGSACKRLNLFLRWMVRRDDVDPGGWFGVPCSKLVVPLDTHMHRASRGLGLTKRRQADMRTSLEITSAFREIAPADPVKYDFALTRLGIRDDTDLRAFLQKCGCGKRAGGDLD